MFPALHLQLSLPALTLLLTVGGCAPVATPASPAVEPAPLLLKINAAVNRQAQPCPADTCLDDWPEAADLAHMKHWDCKAYAVAKADVLMRQYGYDPARLEYVLIAGPPLRVTHAALLVDAHWVLDSGLRCQVCTLERFAAGVEITGRLPVTELPYVRQALHATGRGRP